ncbi:MAG: family 43 glycosylhydrolase [Selenomonadaceae bacterium]|nr:family 43 glycosylhydrolase [Selenomonadaceae bacterium]
MSFKKLSRMLITSLSALALTCSSASAADYALGTFFSSNDDLNMQVYRSDDMIHMEHIFSSTDVAGRDFSCRYHDGVFYICLVEPAESGNSFKILRSSDFKNWTTESFNVVERDEKYNALWAPDLFIDDDGSAYVYFALQNGVDKKSHERTFDICVSRASDIKKLDFGQAEAVRLADYDNVIDAHVCKLNGHYYMIVKNEAQLTNNDNKSPALFRSDDPINDYVEVKDWALNAVRGCEGFSVMSDKDHVYIYADNYSGKYDAAPASHYTVWITDDIERGPFRAEYVESERPMRHGSVILIDDPKADEVISALAPAQPVEEQSVEEPIEEPTVDDQTVDNPIELRTISFDRDDYGAAKGRELVIDKFAPAPDVVYRVPKKTRVTVKRLINAYGVKRMEFVLEPGASLDLGNIFRRDNDGKSNKKYIVERDTGSWNVVAK